MLLKYRNPQFWNEFQKQYWKPRIPTVLRKPFTEFPFSEELLLRGMQGFEQGLRVGDHRKHCLVSVDDAEIEPFEPLRKLFAEKSESLEQLEQNCARVFDDKNFGLMITNMHATHSEIWSGLAAFIQDARHCVEFPVPRAHTDLFYGRYGSNFTGLHKDTQEIFAFVIRGQKRMLAWPFDYFLNKTTEVSPADKFFNKRLSVDYRQYRKDAIVLDAEAGDVIHWPSDYWHVAEVRSDDFSAMLSLGLHQPALKTADAEQSRFKEKLMAGNPCAGLSQDMTDVISRRHAAGQLRWVTGFGFEMGGPVDETARKQSIGTVVKDPSSLLLWHMNTSKRQIVVASGGHSVTLALLPEIETLLKHLAKGEAVKVTEAAQSAESSVVETYWTKRCELKQRKSSARDLNTWLVDWLLRVGAVKRTP